MSSTIRRLVQVALMAAMLAGCTTTGTIDGRVAVWARNNGGTLSTMFPSDEGFPSP